MDFVGIRFPESYLMVVFRNRLISIPQLVCRPHFVLFPVHTRLDGPFRRCLPLRSCDPGRRCRSIEREDRLKMFVGYLLEQCWGGRSGNG